MQEITFFLLKGILAEARLSQVFELTQFKLVVLTSAIFEEMQQFQLISKEQQNAFKRGEFVYWLIFEQNNSRGNLNDHSNELWSMRNTPGLQNQFFNWVSAHYPLLLDPIWLSQNFDLAGDITIERLIAVSKLIGMCQAAGVDPKELWE